MREDLHYWKFDSDHLAFIADPISRSSDCSSDEAILDLRLVNKYADIAF